MRAGWAAIIHANSEDSIKVEVLNDISPVPGAVGFGTVLRSLPTPFLDEWSGKREEARRDRDRLRGEILATHQAGRIRLCLVPGRPRAESGTMRSDDGYAIEQCGLPATRALWRD